MTVKELIEQLQQFDPTWAVCLDVSNDGAEWEGDRVVRHVAGVRIQDGFNMIALDSECWQISDILGYPDDGEHGIELDTNIEDLK